jgi:hypothetical protein
MRFPRGVRLACQTRVSGNGVIIAPVVGNGANVAWCAANESGEATEHVGREKALVLFFLDIRNFTIFVETHAGPAIEGSIKLGPDVHRVVMGYAVNIAARLQNATKELNNNFIISDEVYRLLSIPPEKYQKRSIGLRGVSRTMQVYLLGEPYAFNTSTPLP